MLSKRGRWHRAFAHLVSAGLFLLMLLSLLPELRVWGPAGPLMAVGFGLAALAVNPFVARLFARQGWAFVHVLGWLLVGGVLVCAGAALFVTEYASEVAVDARDHPTAKGRILTKRAAEAGAPVAMYNLGLALLHGYGGEPAPGDGVTWLEAAHRAGYTQAAGVLSDVYLNGPETPRDLAKAEAYGREAVTVGQYAPLYNLALAYQDGKLVSKDMAKAVELYAVTAAKGHIKSEANLGGVLLEGRGVPRDVEAGMAWLEKAADRGNSYAQNELGIAHCDARYGRLDRAKGRRYFTMAADGPNPNTAAVARENLRRACG